MRQDMRGPICQCTMPAHYVNTLQYVNALPPEQAVMVLNESPTSGKCIDIVQELCQYTSLCQCTSRCQYTSRCQCTYFTMPMHFPEVGLSFRTITACSHLCLSQEVKNNTATHCNTLQHTATHCTLRR